MPNVIEVSSLTNNEIIELQEAIKKHLKTCPRKKNSRLHKQYAELSKELYLRTNKILIIPTPKPRKRRVMSETEKRIRRLLKEIGNEEIKQMCLQYL